jgi:hypothetical protein
MFCNFKKISSYWICDRCGRKVKFEEDKEFSPSAKCRLPEYYYLDSGYIFNKKIKGVGDTLSSLIKRIGYSYPSVSPARAKLTLLNNKGIEWCEKNQALIFKWLKQECQIQKLPTIDKVLKAIIRLSIINAKRTNQIFL